jgi:hypothetical protein
LGKGGCVEIWSFGDWEDLSFLLLLLLSALGAERKAWVSFFEAVSLHKF